jgi:hypothetical protein
VKVRRVKGSLITGGNTGSGELSIVITSLMMAFIAPMLASSVVVCMVFIILSPDVEIVSSVHKARRYLL